MKKFVQTALIAAFATGAVLVAPAFADSNDAVRLVANLNGSNVINGGDADGTGTFSAVVDIDNNRLCYDLTTASIGDATYAHIHYGSSNEPGQPVLSLRINDDRCASLSGGTIDAMVANPSNYYVDVVTGSDHYEAIRGQLSHDSSTMAYSGG